MLNEPTPPKMTVNEMGAGADLSSTRTDSGDHPDLQRVGEHRTYHQPDA